MTSSLRQIKAARLLAKLLAQSLPVSRSELVSCNVAKRTPTMGLLNKVKQSQTVKNLAVATAADAKLRRTVGVAATAAKGIQALPLPLPASTRNGRQPDEFGRHCGA